MTTTVADTIRMIPVAQLRPHPKNPRVALRQDVVDAIAVDLEERGHMQSRHALTVRRVDDGYEIISGHHRHASAEAAGLEEAAREESRNRPALATAAADIGCMGRPSGGGE